MKWISDEDERRIREAQVRVKLSGDEYTHRLLGDVLRNIHALGQEQPHPAPRIRELSEAEQRVFYPERHQP